MKSFEEYVANGYEQAEAANKPVNVPVVAMVLSIEEWVDAINNVGKHKVILKTEFGDNVLTYFVKNSVNLEAGDCITVSYEERVAGETTFEVEGQYLHHNKTANDWNNWWEESSEKAYFAAVNINSKFR